MNNIDLPIWKFAFDLVQTAFGVGITIYVWILHKHKANASRINALEEKNSKEQADIKERLVSIETILDHIPQRESIGKIHKRLDEQGKTLHQMEGQLKGMADNNQLILEILLKGGAK